MEIRSVGVEFLYVDWRTEYRRPVVTKLIAAFRNFVNVLKNSYSPLSLVLSVIILILGISLN